MTNPRPDPTAGLGCLDIRLLQRSEVERDLSTSAVSAMCAACVEPGGAKLAQAQWPRAAKKEGQQQTPILGLRPKESHRFGSWIQEMNGKSLAGNIPFVMQAEQCNIPSISKSLL